MRRVAVVALAFACTLVACSPSDPGPSGTEAARGDIDRVEITTSDTLAPDLVFDLGLEYTKPQSRTVWEGEGPYLIDGQPLLLDIYAESLEDGTVLVNTFDGTPQAFLFAQELLGVDLYRALDGERIGSRLLHIAPADDPTSTDPPMVLVIDLRPVRAVGTPVAVSDDDAPIVVLGASGEPQVTIRSGVEEPTELEVVKLIEGAGPQIEPGATILANFKAVFWEDGTEFNSSWPVGQAPIERHIGVGSTLLGWDVGLVDQTEGSQVMLIMPPSYGYPEHGTLVFVVDILDVWNPEE